MVVDSSKMEQKKVTTSPLTFEEEEEEEQINVNLETNKPKKEEIQQRLKNILNEEHAENETSSDGKQKDDKQENENKTEDNSNSEKKNGENSLFAMDPKDQKRKLLRDKILKGM